MSIGARLRAWWAGEPRRQEPGALGLRTRATELRAFVEGVPAVSIADAPLGRRVQLRATVVAVGGRTVVAPIAQRACVLAHVRRGSVDGAMEAGDGDELAMEYQVGVDFALEDGSGRAWVRAKDVAALVEVGARYRSWRQYDDAKALGDAVAGDAGSEVPGAALGSTLGKSGVRVVYGVTDRAGGASGAAREWVVGEDELGLRVQYDERRLEVGQEVRVFCAIDEAVGGDVGTGDGARLGMGYRGVAARRVVRAADDAVWVYVGEP